MVGGKGKSLIKTRSKTLKFRAYFAWKNFERDKNYLFYDLFYDDVVNFRVLITR